MSFLLRLYPAAWRNRYGEEFLALMAAQPPSLGDRVDVVRGAIDARLHPQLPGPVRVRDRTGLATLAGIGFMVLAVILAINGPERYDEYGPYRDGGGALPFLAVAFALLAMGIYRFIDRLPETAHAARTAAAIAILTGFTWSIAPWVAPIGLTFILAFLGFAVGARRARLLPAWVLVVLVAALVLPAALFATTPFLPWYTGRLLGLDIAMILVPLGSLWLVVGGLLVRGFPQPDPS